jgi:hypothetical protein
VVNQSTDSAAASSTSSDGLPGFGQTTAIAAPAISDALATKPMRLCVGGMVVSAVIGTAS